MEKTNIGLVEYCKAQVGLPYWYGTYGNTATKSLLTNKRKQYPNMYDTKKYKTGFEQQIGLRVHDCVGLIKGYLWSDSPTAKPTYKASQDVSADGMLAKCKKQGKIKDMPDIAGLLVFMKGHVGVYIGSGKVVECRGHDYGCVVTKLKDRKWVNFGYCPWIEYISYEEGKKANKDEITAATEYFPRYKGELLSIQDALYELGYDGGFWNRVKIAKKNGITAYCGTFSQNIQLFELLKQGILKK